MSSHTKVSVPDAPLDNTRRLFPLLRPYDASFPAYTGGASLPVFLYLRVQKDIPLSGTCLMPLHNIIGSSTWNGRRNKIRKSFTFVFLEPRSLCSISQSRAGSCFCTFFALLGSVYSALISTIIPLTFCLVLSQLAPCSTTCWGLLFSFMSYGDAWRIRRRAFWQEFNAYRRLNHRPKQLDTSRALLRRLLKEPEEFLHHFRYTLAAGVISVVYGFDVKPENDQNIARAERAFEQLNESAISGNFPVDILPVLRYFPSWMSSAGCKSYTKKARPETLDMFNAPYDEASVSKQDRLILRNEEYYPDPDSFKLGRFLKDGKVDPKHKDLTVNFGNGRRTCPGRFFAMDSL